MNQTSSNELNENDIVDLSKVAQLGQFNDISNGNSSTIFYGGIIFPKDFDYDDEVERTCISTNCRNMSYTIRFVTAYTDFHTDKLYSHEAGPSQAGKKRAPPIYI